MKKILIILTTSLILTGCLNSTPIPESAPSPSPKTASPIEKLTKDWQVFENQQYSYTIKYPLNWNFHPTAINPPPPTNIFLSNAPIGQLQDNYANFTVSVIESLGKNLTSHAEITESIDAGFIKSDLEISGSPAVLLVGINQHLYTANIYVLHGDYFYRLGWQATDENNFNQSKEVFKQILATFKFTD